MAKNTPMYVCSKCGKQSIPKLTICPNPLCRELDSFVLKTDVNNPTKKTAHIGASKAFGVQASKVHHINDVSASDTARIDTSIGEFNRVLGGGLVPGSVVLLGGEPGQGKSTLTLDAAARMSHYMKVLYVSAEESEGQIKGRADRLQGSFGELYMVFESDLETIMEAHIPYTQPELVIIDSLHTVSSSVNDGAPRSAKQLLYCLDRFRQYAKSNNVPFIIIGQVTKDGDIAGSNALSHDVDAVLYLEGDKQLLFRLLRCEKNRFGNIGEVGVFEMTSKGLIEVSNPSEAFLAERAFNKPGSAVAVTMEGNRPILVEVQALTSNAAGTASRRASGLDNERLHIVTTVLDKHILYMPIGEQNVLASAVGGMRVYEPAADLALATALTSSYHNKPTPADIIAIGEIGLTGEVRNVPHLVYRLREAVKLGFKRAVVPPMTRELDIPEGIQLIRAATLDEAMRAIFQGKIAFDAQRPTRANGQRTRHNDDD